LARLYLDHNVSQRLARLLRTNHDVVSARDLGLTRLTDDAQLLAAVRDDRLLVSHNRGDFALLHDAWLTWPAAFGLALPPHPGLLVLDPAPHEALSDVLDAFLAATPPARLANETFWWHHRNGWRRRIIGTGWEPYP
jgi:uncharacterized protein DUF5615